MQGRDDHWCSGLSRVRGLQSCLPDTSPLLLSLSQVGDTNCRAFIHHAAQGDTELLTNLPNQRVALQRTALACLVGSSDGGKMEQ